ncbi:MAG: DMT family transporter, partial [Paracoccaceae bacterium]
GGEKAGIAKYSGVMFGFLGVYFLAIPTFNEEGRSELWAMLIVLLAPISYAVSLNLLRQFKDFDLTVLLALALSVATLLLLPLALAMEGVPVITLPATWISLALIGFVSTGFAFIALYWLVPRVGGTNVSTATFVAPVSAILLGVVLLNETLEAEHLWGIGAIFCGMLMIDGRIVKFFRTAASD